MTRLKAEYNGASKSYGDAVLAQNASRAEVRSAKRQQMVVEKALMAVIKGVSKAQGSRLEQQRKVDEARAKLRSATNRAALQAKRAAETAAANLPGSLERSDAEAQAAREEVAPRRDGLPSWPSSGTIQPPASKLRMHLVTRP